jgi:GT2 family glycosyltransferase
MNKGINKPTKVQVVTGAFLFSHTYKIKQLGGFDERFTFYNEETDLCYRFFNAGGKIYYYPYTSLIHLKGATANRNLTRRYKNESFATIRYFQKHFNGFSYFLACFAHYTGMLIRIPIFSIAGIIKKDKVLIIRAFSNLRNLFTFPTNVFKHQIANRKEFSQ